MIYSGYWSPRGFATHNINRVFISKCGLEFDSARPVLQFKFTVEMYQLVSVLIKYFSQICERFSYDRASTVQHLSLHWQLTPSAVAAGSVTKSIIPSRKSITLPLLIPAQRAVFVLSFHTFYYSARYVWDTCYYDIGAYLHLPI